MKIILTVIAFFGFSHVFAQGTLDTYDREATRGEEPSQEQVENWPYHGEKGKKQQHREEEKKKNAQEQQQENSPYGDHSHKRGERDIKLENLKREHAPVNKEK